MSAPPGPADFSPERVFSSERPALGHSQTTTAQAHYALPSAGRARRLHAGHFAFMRALVQGIAPDEAWARYLRAEGDSGAGLVRSTIGWIRAEFALAATRAHRPGTARLVRLDVLASPHTGNARVRAASDPPEPSGGARSVEPALPSLETFAAEHGLEFESQAEQIAAYEAAYGGRLRALSRRQSLAERQLAALHWLETLLAQPPRAGDAVHAWLDPALAARLSGAGIETLAQLVERINGLGQRWYTGVPALGSQKAARLVAWCRAHESTLEMPLGSHVALPRRRVLAGELEAVVAPATDIRPLEKFLVPPALDGSHGEFRRPHVECLLRAKNDHEAVLAWIGSKTGLDCVQKSALASRRRHRAHGIEHGLSWLQTLSHTQRAYRKEAERFLLWAVLERGRALSSMRAEDCIAYREFLANPTPRARWCGVRSRERWSPLWRPFEGPLSDAAQRQAVAILKSLYRFLVDHNYLIGNPWAAIAAPRRPSPEAPAARSLTRAQWDFARAELERLPPTSVHARTRLALALLYATGLRLSELTAARLEDLTAVQYPPGTEGPAIDGWLLRVVGNGKKIREVPVPRDVVAQLCESLAARGLPAAPGAPALRGVHLLGRARDAAVRAPGLYGGRFADADPAGADSARTGIAPGTLANALKAFFAHCSAVLRAQGDVAGGEQFARASAHWLRHTHASHAIANGVPVEIAQQNLGHASLATTTRYVSTPNERRLRAVEGFWSQT